MKIKYYLIFLIGLLFVFGCEPVAEQVVEEAGTGILVVKSVPADSDLFLNNEYKGTTPLTLYGLPANSYSILIKKEGYEDYKSTVNIEAGKKTEIMAYLGVVKEEIKDESVEEEAEVAEEEEIFIEGAKEEGIIHIDDGVLKYYDFSEKRFTDKLVTGADVFSRRYPTHFVFTRYGNVNIKVIDKNIKQVKREDCADILGSVGFLYSGQTLCVNTKEGYTAAIGGTWEETAGSSLTWKIFD